MTWSGRTSLRPDRSPKMTSVVMRTFPTVTHRYIGE
ncbi:hypothetical protein Cagg_2892 [Chloroflexus aggregans DSM 9485]|uniref:Uncharacterized protein n=1 Tax=Chloroflexus aggregans (strain MD-66 / DSM 9485) TaxID=326427 RepID=B8G620_CHLAD|nr:hypothetical protein Cagg_2892 [Chloroflexus aggregans DSM 9485]